MAQRSYKNCDIFLCGLMLANGTSQPSHMKTIGGLLNIVISISMVKKWKFWRKEVFMESAINGVKILHWPSCKERQVITTHGLQFFTTRRRLVCSLGCSPGSVKIHHRWKEMKDVKVAIPTRNWPARWRRRGPWKKNRSSGQRTTHDPKKWMCMVWCAFLLDAIFF